MVQHPQLVRFGQVVAQNKFIINNNVASTQKFLFHDDNVGIQRAAGSNRANNGNSLYLSAFEEIVLTTGNGVMGTQYERIRTVSDGADAFITFPSVSKISGSSTSTGSFGMGNFADKIGIGTTSPASTLTVAGDISACGS